jgi:hypothetical protein
MQQWVGEAFMYCRRAGVLVADVAIHNTKTHAQLLLVCCVLHSLPAQLRAACLNVLERAARVSHS